MNKITITLVKGYNINDFQEVTDNMRSTHCGECRAFARMVEKMEWDD